MQSYMAYKGGVTDTPLRAARKRKKLSLQALATELGVSLGQMSRIERYGTKSLPHALYLSERLRVSVKALAPRDEAA
jgi:transcriptional regulator with XRE-family HTH domain